MKKFDKYTCSIGILKVKVHSGTEIEFVKAIEFYNDESLKSIKVEDAKEYSRKSIFKCLKNKQTIITLFQDTDSKKWKKGAEVNLYEVEGKVYLRTDKNNIREDNLGELPTYEYQ